MQENLGNLILEIGKKVLEENLQIQIGLSLLNKQGKRALSLEGHAWWDKHRSQKK
jgi:hypothetical protein